MQKKHIKSAIITVFLFFTLVLLPFSSSAAGGACDGFTEGSVNGLPACTKDGGLHICSRNFPDRNFWKYFLNYHNSDLDYVISEEAVESLSYIECASYGIQSLNGIGYFSNLTRLLCRSNKLTELDLSKNPNIQYLFCASNKLTVLVLPENRNLVELHCQNNNLTKLDLSACRDLVEVECYRNNLEYLYLPTDHLERLFCEDNRIQHLNLTNARFLTELNCDYNMLETLELKGTNLKRLQCNFNQLKTLDLSDQSLLEGIGCENNQLETLILTSSPCIEQLFCANNNLTELDLRGMPNLQHLYCDSNKLIKLEIDSGALHEFDCNSNCLTRLELNSEVLEILDCSNNQLTDLLLGNARKLRSLYAENNALLQIDLTNCPNLAYANLYSQNATVPGILIPRPEDGGFTLDLTAILGTEGVQAITDVYTNKYYKDPNITYDNATGILTLREETNHITYSYYPPTSSKKLSGKLEMTVYLPLVIDCAHVWEGASPGKAAHCSHCGVKAKQCQSHSMVPATETQPPWCSVCGYEGGHPLRHVWSRATLTIPSHCIYCYTPKTDPGKYHLSTAGILVIIALVLGAVLYFVISQRKRRK